MEKVPGNGIGDLVLCHSISIKLHIDNAGGVLPIRLNMINIETEFLHPPKSFNSAGILSNAAGNNALVPHQRRDVREIGGRSAQARTQRQQVPQHLAKPYYSFLHEPLMPENAKTFTKLRDEKRDSRRNPSVNTPDRLEHELQRKLELTHTGGRTRRRIGFDVCDAAITGAVNRLTGTALVRVESQHRMVEYVEGIHAELRFHPFGNREVLHQRRVRKECSRTAQAIH